MTVGDDFTFSSSASYENTTDRRRKTLFCAAIILLIAAVISITLGVTLNKDDTSRAIGESEAGATPAPTPIRVEVATPAPTFSQQESVVRDFALFGGEEFEDPASAQSQALEWVLANFDFSSSVSASGGGRSLQQDKRLMRIYALAVVYFSTNTVQTIYTDALWGQGVVLEWKNSSLWMTSASECTWYGVTCNGDDEVEALELYKNNLSGSLPQEITLLTSLKKLDLFDNPIFNDGVDGNDWLGDLTSLEYLYYGSTNFAYDGIPTSISKLTNLVEYDCSYTLYFGAIDGSAFEGLDNLSYLAMGGNYYESSVPSQLASLPNLRRLYIEDAILTGSLDFMEQMPAIFELWMDFNAGITGSIPAKLPTSLESWSVTECNLTGSLPTELGLLTGMQQMWLYENNLTGSVPTELGQLSAMKFFHIEVNDLEGTVPAQVCGLTDAFLEELQMDCSTGTIECSCCSACF